MKSLEHFIRALDSLIDRYRKPKDPDVFVEVNLSERGRNGGKARAARLGPSKLKKAAKKAAKARWDKYRAENSKERGV